jgi:hypothetical protein
MIPNSNSVNKTKACDIISRDKAGKQANEIPNEIKFRIY